MLGGTFALAALGPAVARWIRFPAIAILVPMILGMVLVARGWLTLELPREVLAAAYAVIAWRIGVNFTRPLLLHAVRLLPAVLVAVFLMLGACATASPSPSISASTH